LNLSAQLSAQETLFGRTVTPAERLRQHQRSLAKAQRELDRERTKLEQSEKKLIADIKKSAKDGQLVSSLENERGPLSLTLGLECVQSHGEGSGPDTTLRPEVLPNADPASGCWPTYTNSTVEPTNGGGHARSHSGTLLPIA